MRGIVHQVNHLVIIQIRRVGSNLTNFCLQSCLHFRFRGCWSKHHCRIYFVVATVQGLCVGLLLVVAYLGTSSGAHWTSEVPGCQVNHPRLRRAESQNLVFVLLSIYTPYQRFFLSMISTYRRGMIINRPLPYIFDIIILLISVGGVSQPEKNDDVSRNLSSVKVYRYELTFIFPTFYFPSRSRRFIVGSTKHKVVAFGAVQISR